MAQRGFLDRAKPPAGLDLSQLQWLMPTGQTQALAMQGQGSTAQLLRVPHDTQLAAAALRRHLPGAPHVSLQPLTDDDAVCGVAQHHRPGELMVLGAMQHPVLLTRGYWLADSACTQALWQSVTRQNPSRFADDDQGPVEQVSWDDVCNDFLPKLAHTDPGLALRPPTEAEWEFAARCAGQAMRSFGWGEGITTDHANYDGNNPLRNGDK